MKLYTLLFFSCYNVFYYYYYSWNGLAAQLWYSSRKKNQKSKDIYCSWDFIKKKTSWMTIIFNTYYEIKSINQPPRNVYIKCLWSYYDQLQIKVVGGRRKIKANNIFLLLLLPVHNSALSLEKPPQPVCRTQQKVKANHEPRTWVCVK